MPPTNNTMHTYVEFIRPSKTSRAGTATTRRVDSRDLATLDIPAGTTVFYFYDSPLAAPSQAAAEQHNCSKFHIVAQKLLTRDQVKKLIAPRVQGNDAARIIWDVRIQQNRLFAQTYENTVEPVTQNHVVIDTAKKQLWPRPRRPRAGKTLRQDFDVALKNDVKIGKPLVVKKKNGQPRPGK